MLCSLPIVLLLCSSIIIVRSFVLIDQHNDYVAEEPLFLYPATALAIRNENDAAKVLQSSNVTHLGVRNALEGYLVTRLFTYNSCKELFRVYGSMLNTCLLSGPGSVIFTANSTSTSTTLYRDSKCASLAGSYVYSLRKSCKYYVEEYVSSDLSFLSEAPAFTYTFR